MNKAAKELMESWSPLVSKPEMRKLDRSIGPSALGASRKGWRDQLDVQIAQLMENTVTSGGMLNEDSTSAANPNSNSMILPVLRKSMGASIAADLAVVQAISLPTAQVYLEVYRAANSRGSTTANTSLTSAFARNYSSEFVDEESVGTGNAVATVFVGTLRHTPIRPFSANLGHSVVLTDGNEDFTDDGAGVLTGSEGGSGTINYTDGTFSVTFDGAPADGDALVCSYYQNQEGSSDVGQITLGYDTVTITAESKRLSVTFTLEHQEDLRAALGIDPKTRLIEQMAQQIVLEQDRRIIQLQLAAAVTTDTLGYAGTIATEVEHARNLFYKLDAIAARIGQRTRGPRANYIVCPTEVITLLNQMAMTETYRSLLKPETAGSNDALEVPMAGFPLVRRWGTYQGKFIVYEDPFLSEGLASKEILVGYRGDGYAQAGTIVAPYIPVQIIEMPIDADTMRQKIGIRTRVGIKVVRAEYYGKLTVTGLPNLG